jgi:hypothetical protein
MIAQSFLLGMIAQSFYDRGIDSILMNFGGAGGERTAPPNLKPRHGN